ncbi:sel1 repeat family protein [Lutibacter sp. HS1-25]|uniref:tetratricopeptide repeat protein n=1 Tax=Lutibacter sp. HS1-25 TaxID=2485000 RepID=UPI001012292A|nr:SEL1-like repeat protein [Lutibacter sp. HS1-25]RXP52250.1 sel1 repeat family protein [Lutibacter sp. HS1-25]
MSRLYLKTSIFLLLLLTSFGCKTYVPQLNSEILRKAQNDDAEAQFEMGKIYFESAWKQPTITKSGTVTRNWDEAEQWFVKSANQGHTAAKFYLHYQFQKINNYECLSDCLEKVAYEGIAEAQYLFGSTYLTDKFNTPKDLSLAYKWMLLSAQNDYEHYQIAWNLINHFNISHLEISKGQKMAKKHVEKYGISKSMYPEK